MVQNFDNLSVAIVFFGFNRPEKISKSIRSYLCCVNAQTDNIYVFVDGPRNPEEKKLTDETYDVACELLENLNSNITYRESNYGLKSSIYKGISDILTKHTAVIVIEDDLLLNPYFYEFMYSSLNFYKNNKNIFQVSGFTYLNEKSFNPFFLPITTSWGWATWSDRWEFFDINTDYSYLLKSKSDIKAYNFNNSFNFTKMLNDELNSNISSWAIRWYSYVFSKNGLVLYPPESLVINDGFDLSGTHSSYTGKGLFSNHEFSDSKITSLSNDIYVDSAIVSRLVKHFKKAKWMKFFSYFKSKFKWR